MIYDAVRQLIISTASKVSLLLKGGHDVGQWQE
jgi:hypothetical protein